MHTIPTAEVSRSFVLSKCNYFVDVQLWPLQSRLNPERWLANFRDSEMDHAVHLLNAFLYYSNLLVEELFKAAFQRLSTMIGCAERPYEHAQAHWRSFRRDLLVTYTTGETPSETDSGYVFARMARQALRIPETQIISPERAIHKLISERPRPVLLVDDFVGSGDQTARTWHRELTLPNGATTSLARLSRLRDTLFFYSPVACAELGRRAILSQCPRLQLCPAHFLSDRYSATSPDSLIWPERLRPGALDFLQTTSSRAGIAEHQWAGYKGLALTVAFEHGVPDATLPLFYHHSNRWHPLLRRA